MSYSEHYKCAVENDKVVYTEDDYNTNNLQQIENKEEFLELSLTKGKLILEIVFDRFRNWDADYTKVMLSKSGPLKDIKEERNDVLDRFNDDERNLEKILQKVCRRSLIKNESVYYHVW
jgi:hypothetical protein